MESTLNMALYSMALQNARIGMEATQLLEFAKIATVDELKAALSESTLVEQYDIDGMNVEQMIDALLAAEQYATFS